MLNMYDNNLGEMLLPKQAPTSLLDSASSKTTSSMAGRIVLSV